MAQDRTQVTRLWHSGSRASSTSWRVKTPITGLYLISKEIYSVSGWNMPKHVISTLLTCLSAKKWERNSTRLLQSNGSTNSKEPRMGITTSFMRGSILLKTTCHAFCQKTSYQLVSLCSSQCTQTTPAWCSHNQSTRNLELMDSTCQSLFKKLTNKIWQSMMPWLCLKKMIWSTRVDGMMASQGCVVPSSRPFGRLAASSMVWKSMLPNGDLGMSTWLTSSTKIMVRPGHKHVKTLTQMHTSANSSANTGSSSPASAPLNHTTIWTKIVHRLLQILTDPTDRKSVV